MIKIKAVAISLIGSLVLTGCGGTSNNSSTEQNPKNSPDSFMGYNKLNITPETLAGTWVAIGKTSEVRTDQVDDNYELTIKSNIKSYFIIRPTDTDEFEFSDCLTTVGNFQTLEINNNTVVVNDKNSGIEERPLLKGEISENNSIIVDFLHFAHFGEEEAQIEMVKISNEYKDLGEFVISSPQAATESFEIACVNKNSRVFTDNEGNQYSGDSFITGALVKESAGSSWAYMENGSAWNITQAVTHFEAGSFFDQIELSPTQFEGSESGEIFSFDIIEETDFTTMITFIGKQEDQRVDSGISINFNGSLTINLPTQ